jgi:hypothetical protein
MAVMKLKISEHCKGCMTYDVCTYGCDTVAVCTSRIETTFKTNPDGECPCSDCIVKSMCQDECDRYTKFRSVGIKNMSEPIPCKNCLILGICKHKVVLECSLLYQFFHRKLRCNTEYDSVREIMSLRYSYLPNNGLRKIVNGKNKREFIWF